MQYMIVFERESDDEALPPNATQEQRFEQLLREFEGQLDLTYINLTKGMGTGVDLIFCTTEFDGTVTQLRDRIQLLYDDYGVSGFFNIFCFVTGYITGLDSGNYKQADQLAPANSEQDSTGAEQGPLVQRVLPRIFTPFEMGGGQRLALTLSDEDWSKIKTREHYTAVVTDERTGTIVRVQDADCGAGCRCAAEVVEIVAPGSREMERFD